MTIVEELGKYHKVVSTFLDSYLREKSQMQITFAQDLQTKLLPFLKRGKMIRASLILHLCSKWNCLDEHAIKIAAAMELYHGALLIHDDIMDNDSTRRGLPTIHTQYAEHKTKHYGEGQAICLGDISFFLANELLSNFPDISRLYAQELVKTGFGQMQDLKLSYEQDTKKETILEMFTYKTARYTFVLPMLAAAQYANYPHKDVLEEIGLLLGLVFQIKDDLLGLKGDPHITGKAVGSDIRERKATIYRAVLDEVLPLEEKEFVDSIYAKEEMSADDITCITEKIFAYGVDTKVEAQLQNYYDDCIAVIQKTDITFLADLAEYLHTRDK